MKRCVVIGGADINNYKRVSSYFKSEDFFVFCDCGLNHKDLLKVIPNLIIGDFDSHSNPNCDIETIILPTEKDDTDTVYAVKEMIKRGYDEFLLVGVVGNRLDHTLGNLSILLMLYNENKKVLIVDDYSEIEILGKEKIYLDTRYKYFSLVNIFGVAKGINIKNAKYNLENAEIKMDYQYGISNEVEKNKIAEVSVDNGNLLLIKIISE